MPMIEFKCACGHEFEALVPMRDSNDNTTCTCAICLQPAPRVLFSRTLEPHFYGNPAGYYKPSPTKRTSTKVVSGLSGNKNALG